MSLDWVAAAEEPETEEAEPDTPKLPAVPNKCCSWICNPLYPPNYAKVNRAGSPLKLPDRQSTADLPRRLSHPWRRRA